MTRARAALAAAVRSRLSTRARAALAAAIRPGLSARARAALAAAIRPGLSARARAALAAAVRPRLSACARAALAAILLACLGAAGGCGGADDPAPPAAPPDSGSSAAPQRDEPTGAVLGEYRSKRPGRIRIGPTSRFDITQGAALPVRVRLGRGPHRLTAALIVGRDRVRLAEPRRLRGSGMRRLELAVRDAATARLADCRSGAVSVTLRDRRGRAVARRAVELRATAPDCDRFFGRAAVWNRPLPADAPIDPQSDAFVADVRRQVQEGFDKSFPPTINTTSYSAPVYTVPADQRRVPVRLTRGRDYGQALQKTLDEGVPIPDDAQPAKGGDAHLVVWQPSTDTMWELWTAKRVDGRWQAGWGGRMEHMSRSKGYFSDPWGIQPGATATSLPLVGGLITFRDLRRGEIDHALAMALPSSRHGVWALPAQRSDGNARRPDAIPQGARLRLDPNLDIDSLGLPPFTAMLARAAQRYGILVRDTSAVVTLYAEDPSPTGGNPWAGAIKPSASGVLRAFPWDRLQVMQMDLRTYGNKPVER